MTQAPGPREVLGAPIVPPGRVTAALNRARTAWLGLHRRSAPPSIRVLEGLFGLFDNRVLGLLVELDIADRLDGPTSAAALAAGTDLEPEALDRLLRYAAGRGFVGCDRRGRYRANGVTRLLRADNPFGWRGWVEFAGSDWFWRVFRDAPDAVRGGDAVVAATGHPFFEYVNDVEPAAGRAFNAAMEAGGRVQALALARGLDWDGIGTVCDVGGGTGAALELLLAAHPALRGILYDLPSVVGHARPGIDRNRCIVQGGDFFSSVPAGADRYLLLAVVHDWDDERAAVILGNVRDAMGPDGEAVVVEGVLSARPRGDFVSAADLLMLLVGPGRERTDAQFDALFARAGLMCTGTTVLATGFSALHIRRA